MPTTKELKETRAPIRKQLLELGTKIKAEGRAMNAEEKEKYEKLGSEFRSLTAAIEDAGKFDEFEKSEESDGTGRSGGGGDRRIGRGDILLRKAKGGDGASESGSNEQRALAMQAWFRSAAGMAMTDEHKRACRKTGFDPSIRQIELNLGRRAPRFDRHGQVIGGETRDQGVATGAAGGYAVAPEFMTNLERAMKSYNGPRQVCDVMRTDTGAQMPWPTVDDTANEGELLAENTTIGTQDAAFGNVVFNAYKFSSKMIAVSYELLNDSAFNFAEVLGNLLGERIGRIQGRKFTLGTGSGEPQGIVTGSTLGVTAGSATALAVNDIIKLKHSIDPAYRNDPTMRFMMNDAIMLAATLLTDNQNRPIFVESYRDGSPDTLLGVPIVINQFMAAATAATNKTILAGPMRQFKIRDVGQLRLKRLDERLAEKDQVAFLAFMRSDSHMLNAGQNPIKHLVH